MRLLASIMIALGLAGSVATPAAATNEYRPIIDRGEFLSLIQGKSLRIGAFGVNLNVLPNGQIQGRASGWDLTGTWSWQDGYFCREMDWSGYEIGYNCQLVEVRGSNRMRFTVDRGAGDSAVFNLR